MSAQQPELAPGEARRILAPILLCRCARCGYQWASGSKIVGAEPAVPRCCPPGGGCGATGWRKPAGPMGLAAMSPKRRRAISRQGVAARRAASGGKE